MEIFLDRTFKLLKLVRRLNKIKRTKKFELNFWQKSLISLGNIRIENVSFVSFSCLGFRKWLLGHFKFRGFTGINLEKLKFYIIEETNIFLIYKMD